MNYHELKQHESKFLALTSLTPLEFEYLFSFFEPRWEAFYRYHTLEGKKRIILSYKEHGNSLLQGTEQKLFFLLVYMKNNPLQVLQASSFGVSQPKVSKIYRVLLSVLDDTLQKMGLSPCRDSLAVKQCLESHKSKVFWVDGTETRIQRNQDQDAQKQDFSGKQKGHRLINLTLCDASQYIWYLSPTESGSMHDKALTDLYPIHLPFGCILKQDLGFVGHTPCGVTIEQPFKKPKNKELDFSKKIYNQLFSSTRIVVEHANSGFKRLRMMKDVLRIHNETIRDKIRSIACALHNLRVQAFDPIRRYQVSPRLHAYEDIFS